MTTLLFRFSNQKDSYVVRCAPHLVSFLVKDVLDKALERTAKTKKQQTRK